MEEWNGVFEGKDGWSREGLEVGVGRSWIYLMILRVLIWETMLIGSVLRLFILYEDCSSDNLMPISFDFRYIALLSSLNY